METTFPSQVASKLFILILFILQNNKVPVKTLYSPAVM